MKLTILGSGTTRASKTRSAPAFLLKVGKDLILMDSGEGTKRRLAEAGIDDTKIQYIFYTHLHNDHVNELSALLWSWLAVRKRMQPLTIVGPKGIKAFFNDLVKIYFVNFYKKIKFKIKVKELTNSTIRFPHWTLRTIKSSKNEGLTRYKNAIALRVTCQNKSFVYAGDVRYEETKPIINISQKVDALLIEAAAPNEKKMADHITPGLAGEIATKVRANKLILNHFYFPDELNKTKKQAQKTFSGEIILAKDLMEIEI